MTNFELTLSIIQDNLKNILKPQFIKIWVQGSNKSDKTTLMFTIFDRNGYRIKSIDIKNFRQYRPSGNIDEEMSFIDRHILSFRSILTDYII